MFECCMLNKQDEFRVLHEPMGKSLVGEFPTAKYFAAEHLPCLTNCYRRRFLLWTGTGLEPIQYRALRR